MVKATFSILEIVEIKKSPSPAGTGKGLTQHLERCYPIIKL